LLTSEFDNEKLCFWTAGIWYDFVYIC